MNDKESFDWIPFYTELARQSGGVPRTSERTGWVLQQLRAQGLTITPLEDEDETGRHFLLSEIDPFTFFGSFNRGIVTETRVGILEAVKSRFGVAAPIPSSFTGVPILNNQKSWFFASQHRRKPGDVDRLWEVFSRALSDCDQ